MRDSGPLVSTKPPVCWDRCRGKPSSCSVRCNSCSHLQVARPKARPPSSRSALTSRPSHHWWLLASASTSSSEKPSALPTSRIADFGPVADHHAGHRRAVAAVLAVDVLDTSSRRSCSKSTSMSGGSLRSLRDEALEEHVHARRVDLGDAEAVADGASWPRSRGPDRGCAASARRHDVGDGEEVRLVPQLAISSSSCSICACTLAGMPLGQRRPAPS